AYFSDDIVGESGLSSAILLQRLANGRFTIESKELDRQQLVERFDQFPFGKPEGAVQNPKQLTDYRKGNKHRFQVFATFFEQAVNYFSLPCVVVSDVPDEYVGVNRPHVPE